MPSEKPTAKKVAERIGKSESDKQTEGAKAAKRSVEDSDENSKPVGGEDQRTPHEGAGGNT